MKIHIPCRTIGHLKLVKELFEKYGGDNYEEMINYWYRYKSNSLLCFETHRDGWWIIREITDKHLLICPDVYLEFSNELEDRFKQLLKERGKDYGRKNEN